MTNITSILEKLIGFKTITSDIDENKKALLWCQDLLFKSKISSKILTIEGRPVLIWGADPDKCHLLVNTHIDVVPAPEISFSAKVNKTMIVGRGSLDTKASVAALMSLSADFVRTAISKNICFAVVSDEETGGWSSRNFIESLPQLKWALFLEPTNLQVVNQAKGIIQVKITAAGKAAHGSRPWLGKNAIEIINAGLSKFLKIRPTPQSDTFATTYNFSLISGGKVINQIPDSCSLSLDIRFKPTDNPQKILFGLKKVFSNCEVEPLKIESHIFSSLKNSKTQIFCQSLVKNKIVPQFNKDHASSDARHCTAIGVPAIIFGPSGRGMHEDRESVNLESISMLSTVLETFINSI